MEPDKALAALSAIKGKEKWEEEGLNPFEEPKPPRPQYCTHLFSHGETLASVAMRHKMELNDLLKVNRLSKWSHVRTGQILYVRTSPSIVQQQQQQQQQQKDDAEGKSDGAADVIVTGSPERRSHSLDEQRSQPIPTTTTTSSTTARAPFGRGALHDLSKSAGSVEEELAMLAAATGHGSDPSTSLGRSLSHSSSSSSSSSSKDLSRQRSRLLIDASLEAKSDVYRDDRVKYSQGQDHVTGILVVTSYRFIFQPSSTDQEVQKKGFLHYQLNISIRDIYDCCEEVGLSQYLLSDTYVQVCVKQKLGQSKASGTEGKVVNGKILYFLVSRQRSQALVQKLSAAMEKHKGTNALSHNRRQKAAAVLPRRSMMVSPEASQGSAADPQLHDGPSSLLLVDDIRAIQMMLPVRERSCDWQLLYSSEKHGVSLSTLYNRARNKGSTVMIIEDSLHHTFGAFCSEAWQVSDKYYGTGNSFLFKLYPKKAFYLWTGVNNFVQLSGEDFLSVGGGSGTMGLWLNDDFSGGSSQTCDTFANAPLASTEEFGVLSVEVWGFVSSE